MITIFGDDFIGQAPVKAHGIANGKVKYKDHGSPR